MWTCFSFEKSGQTFLLPLFLYEIGQGSRGVGRNKADSDHSPPNIPLDEKAEFSPPFWYSQHAHFPALGAERGASIFPMMPSARTQGAGVLARVQWLDHSWDCHILSLVWQILEGKANLHHTKTVFWPSSSRKCQNTPNLQPCSNAMALTLSGRPQARVRAKGFCSLEQQRVASSRYNFWEEEAGRSPPNGFSYVKGSCLVMAEACAVIAWNLTPAQRTCGR